MDGLLSICDRENIAVFYRNPLTRSGRKLGYYFCNEDGDSVILLDSSLIGRVRLKRCVLAEELGHYFCGTTGSVVQLKAFNISNGQARGKDERRGKAWAANHLIPTIALAKAATRGILLPHELADYFEVEEWMVWRKIHVLRTDLREQWKLRVAAPDIMSPLLVHTMWGEAV